MKLMLALLVFLTSTPALACSGQVNTVRAIDTYATYQEFDAPWKHDLGVVINALEALLHSQNTEEKCVEWESLVRHTTDVNLFADATKRYLATQQLEATLVTDDIRRFIYLYESLQPLIPDKLKNEAPADQSAGLSFLPS